MRISRLRLESNHGAAYVRAIHDNTSTEDNCGNSETSTQLVVCLLGAARQDVYNAIKVECCLNQGIPSQCVVARTVKRQERVMSVATKIAIQINAKLGGDAWCLSISLPDKQALMVVGIDTHHTGRLGAGQGAAH